MQFELFTLFPELMHPYFEFSILKRAIEHGHLKVGIHNIRDWATDKHHVTDYLPYGGGGGMVMKPEPIFASVEEVLGKEVDCPLILMTPQGRPFDQKIAEELSSHKKIAILCGRYEGVDERVRQNLVTDEISIGDYVITGGELSALIVIDAVMRLIPGVLGDPGAAQNDSHAMGLLEYPHYTRPAEFRGWNVPEVLLSGHHAEINRWRRQQALIRTLQRRPDILESAELSEEDKKFLKIFTEEALRSSDEEI
ncbi:MAG: tRNA (guanosine(37)-N1)-methyltransferase TrmD [Anaerolineaceae bacterium]|nr:tRNA (guanosine(37)-N1)-methyltransferase TrmD [Anaerolineaceae bacterium]